MAARVCMLCLLGGWRQLGQLTVFVPVIRRLRAVRSDNCLDVVCIDVRLVRLRGRQEIRVLGSRVRTVCRVVRVWLVPCLVTMMRVLYVVRFLVAQQLTLIVFLAMMVA